MCTRNGLEIVVYFSLAQTLYSKDQVYNANVASNIPNNRKMEKRRSNCAPIVKKKRKLTNEKT
jgi:hypothetical protein